MEGGKFMKAGDKDGMNPAAAPLALRIEKTSRCQTDRGYKPYPQHQRALPPYG